MNNNSNQSAITQRRPLSLTLMYAVFGMAAAVALPQILHVFGAATGLGTLPGETFLPMHLPVLLTGFLAGPLAGLLCGLGAPAVSMALTGMPLPAMMPFMTIELAVYGLSAGLVRPVGGEDRYLVIKTLTAQVAGRALRAVAILIAFYGLGMTMIAPPVIWNSVIAGIPGIIIQLVAVPVIVKLADRVKGNTNE